MGTCFGCSPTAGAVADSALVDHLRLLHPDVYGDGPERLADGSVVVVDMTLNPDDFKKRPMDGLGDGSC
jgi:hypothetical protein